MNQPPEPGGPPLPKVEYANFFQIGHNGVEVVLDFGYGYDDEHAALHTRIVTTPRYAKALLDLLRESLERYEQGYGPITRA
jgi:hypothetical protein